MSDAVKGALHDCLRAARASVVDRVDGLSEHDRRRPLTGTGTNLLGLVKHLVGVETGYLGDSFGRPRPEPLPWYADGSVWDGADMWATEDESSDDLLALYAEACARSDRTVDELGLDARGQVAWWPPERRDVDLGTILVRVLDDTARHAGQADIVRELVDGRGGRDQDAIGDAAYWRDHVARVQRAADTFR